MHLAASKTMPNQPIQPASQKGGGRWVRIWIRIPLRNTIKTTQALVWFLRRVLGHRSSSNNSISTKTITTTSFPYYYCYYYSILTKMIGNVSPTSTSASTSTLRRTKDDERRSSLWRGVMERLPLLLQLLVVVFPVFLYILSSCHMSPVRH